MDAGNCREPQCLCSPRRGDIRYPQIPVCIDEIGFAEAVGLIDGTGQYREAKPARYCFSLIRIATVQPQFRSHTARYILAETGVQGVIQVGMIGVEHPFNLAIAQHGEIGIAIDNLGAEHLTVKWQRPADVPHQEVECQPLQGMTVLGGWHPGIAGSQLHNLSLLWHRSFCTAVIRRACPDASGDIAISIPRPDLTGKNGVEQESLTW